MPPTERFEIGQRIEHGGRQAYICRRTEIKGSKPTAYRYWAVDEVDGKPDGKMYPIKMGQFISIMGVTRVVGLDLFEQIVIEEFRALMKAPTR